MRPHWSALGKVAVVGAGGLPRHRRHLRGRLSSPCPSGPPPRAHGGAGRAALASACLCFASCAAAVLYAIYLIIPQFHG